MIASTHVCTIRAIRYTVRTFIAIVIIFLFTPFNAFGHDVSEAKSQVWKVGKKRWTVAEEYRYSKWVERNITEDFFVRHEIPVDCADVAYAVRWIYARIAHVPAAATTVDNTLIGHWSQDWQHLPTHSQWYKDRRFRAALLTVLGKTWTGTVPADTYPTRIAPDSISAGTVFLLPESHAGIIGNVILDGSTAHPLQTWEASTPPRIKKLYSKNFSSTNPDSLIRSGLLKFRWPVKQVGSWRFLPV
jgi:hypothetical protein